MRDRLQAKSTSGGGSEGKAGDGDASVLAVSSSDMRVQLVCFATLLYAREGWAAPPESLLQVRNPFSVALHIQRDLFGLLDAALAGPGGGGVAPR